MSAGAKATQVLKRVFDLDLEHCPNCGGELKIIAAILEAPVIEKILTHLGLQARAPLRAPARGQALQAEPGHQQSGGLLVPGEGRATGPARAARPRCGLQRPERAGLVRIAVDIGHGGRPLLFDQHRPTGEQLHRAGDDLAQHRQQRFVSWRGGFDERRRPVKAAPVNAVQDQAVQVNVQLGGRVKALPDPGRRPREPQAWTQGRIKPQNRQDSAAATGGLKSPARLFVMLFSH